MGALRELVRAGERPDFLVGASVGALNACFFACAPDASGVEQLESIWCKLRRSDIFPVGFAGVLRMLGRGSLFDSRHLRTLVERNLPIRDLEQAKLPVHVVATNLSGATVVLSRGPRRKPCWQARRYRSHFRPCGSATTI
uniref:Patatin-like phospholipase family protein n=1 Tax=Phenylobacterium glaciei TaxID=2803784 RepID=A0A974SA08_9CAUL|nr:patatin-like phospholipase family protein [Phenylobacterium glaciei]